MTVKIYVEGGGDHDHSLDRRCREGFSKFFENAGLKGRMPGVISCGGRQRAFHDFETALQNSKEHIAVLLVDSEAPVKAKSPWDHVLRRTGDGWKRPKGAKDDQLHLMVEAMEAWFHADPDTLASYYGKGFRKASLRSPKPDTERISKADLYDGLQKATAACKQKGKYSKGGHSFVILALIDPAKVRKASPYADRLLSFLDRVCS